MNTNTTTATAGSNDETLTPYTPQGGGVCAEGQGVTDDYEAWLEDWTASKGGRIDTDYVAAQMGQKPPQQAVSVEVDPWASFTSETGLKAYGRNSMAMLQKPQPMDWVLPGLRVGQVGFLVSPGGTGKSFWALQAAYSVATGRDLCGFADMGHTIKRGDCVYLSFEDDKLALDWRNHHIYNAFPSLHNDNALQLVERNRIIPMAHGRLNLAELDERMERFAELITGKRLVVVDTLRQAHSGDEDSNGEMSDLVGNLHNIARKANTAMLMLHHASKGAVLNGQGDKAQAARGASALTDNIRSAFYMANMTPDQASTMYETHGIDLNPDYWVRWGTSKNNHAQASGAQWYHRSEGGVLVKKTLHLKAEAEKALKAKQADKKAKQEAKYGDHK